MQKQVFTYTTNIVSGDTVSTPWINIPGPSHVFINVKPNAASTLDSITCEQASGVSGAGEVYLAEASTTPSVGLDQEFNNPKMDGVGEVPGMFTCQSFRLTIETSGVDAGFTMTILTYTECPRCSIVSTSTQLAP